MVLREGGGSLPVDAGDVNDEVDHVTTEFVGLHVDGRRVGRDVNLTDDVEQKRLLDARVLRVRKNKQVYVIDRGPHRSTQHRVICCCL